MSNFKVTAAMLNGFCQNGLTVEEMAIEITNQSGTKCSVGAIRKFCKHYGISLKAKPRKSVFTLDSIETEENTNVETTVNSTVGELDAVEA